MQRTTKAWRACCAGVACTWRCGWAHHTAAMPPTVSLAAGDTGSLGCTLYTPALDSSEGSRMHAVAEWSCPAAQVAPVSRLDWARNASGLRYADYWRGTLKPRPTGGRRRWAVAVLPPRAGWELHRGGRMSLLFCAARLVKPVSWDHRFDANCLGCLVCKQHEPLSPLGRPPLQWTGTCSAWRRPQKPRSGRPTAPP